MGEYETVIGLEVHAQLLTRSKMFCPCPADYQQAAPNTRVCPVCLGLPGTLPVINREAVRAVIMTGLALGSDIAADTKFDRKNYAYPDLMKGYQISQYDMPLCTGGHLDVETEDGMRRVGVHRVHLEEDVAKLSHHTDGATGDAYSLVDVNRSGIPLMEMVSEPDMRSADEARQYLLALHSTLLYLGVSTAQMEEGAFRCDANVSIRPRGADWLGPKVEVKNMNSFRAVHRALEYEIERQIAMAERGERIVQETRGWVEERGVTVSQRSKEDAHDYRYFPEPDLPPLAISREWVEQVQARLPQLPAARRDRFMDEYGLSPYDASHLTASKDMADFFEDTLAAESLSGDAQQSRAKAVANWLTGEATRLLNASGTEIADSSVTPQALAELVALTEGGTVGSTQAKVVFEEMFRSGASPKQIVQEKGLAQISDAEDIAPSVEQALADNPQAVQDYLGGKETVVRFLVGQVMRLTRGRANPGLVTQLLEERLAAMKQE